MDGTRIAVDRQVHRLPYELLEMIISNLIYDTPSLKTCAATCFAWYTVAAPYLHHTLRLRRWYTRKDIIPLTVLHELGLVPLVKKVHFPSEWHEGHWVVPEIFDSKSLRYFSTLSNVQELVVTGLDLPKFTSGTENYFGHFSPTLRSIALLNPIGTPWRLVNLLGLFPNLDDIKIVRYSSGYEAHNAVDVQRAQIRGSLRGKLEMDRFWDRRLSKEIVASFEAMRFTFMDLGDVGAVQLLLDACAETLQTLRFRPEGLFRLCKRFFKEDITASKLTEPEMDSPNVGPKA